MKTCRLCGERFGTVKELMAHKKEVHGVRFGPVGGKKKNPQTKKKVVEEKRIMGLGVVKYCPCCGLDMESVGKALAFIRKVKG